MNPAFIILVILGSILLWFLLSFVAIFVDDFLRWKVFDGEKPHYTLWWKK